MGADITFVVAGQERVVHAERGPSIMDVAVRSAIPGIVGECGGNALCATCHVYLDDSMGAEFSPMGEDEDEMLDESLYERRSSSRLSCQLLLSQVSGLGLRVTVPGAETPR